MNKISITFITNFGERWQVTKQFKNDNHLNNFINYICKSKNYICDEIQTDGI